ncbi:centrosomal protein of 63 kDa isoform X2 [Dunckerocampus dactyliophorus]|uniref:centrosomal protein of 63 kDa isoform X2 n=1 Tax=Dunckerocampus dactyliophorus TaxID=161453 RepID=UPI0024070CAF|nr:centrosomal protein of 63 kDa isoform X2 [Dunckerocampus dactyliophorus]
MDAHNPDLSSVLSDCEPELQELMRQIDIMIDHQKSDWEAQMQEMQLQLKSGQEEMSASRVLLERKDLEIGVLRQQLEDVQTGRQALATKYEKQLQNLDKLKRSYHKLQRRHLKKLSSEESKEVDKSEVRLLSDKLEEYSRSCVKWEQQCLLYQKQLSSLEAQKKSLADELTHVKAEAASLASLEKSYVSSLRHLEQDNLQLRRDLAETRRQLELFKGGTTAPAAADQSQPAGENANGEGTTSYEGEIQRLFTQLKTSGRSRDQAAPGGCHGSTASATAADRRISGGDSAPTPVEHAPEGWSSSSEDTPSSREESAPSPMEPLPPSSADVMVSRFLEEESLLSSELMQKLDSHILSMTENNVRTVSERLTAASPPDL